MHRRISLSILTLFIFCASLFTGCQDAAEVDDNVYIITLGIDKGSHNKIILTIQYPNYAGGGGGGGGMQSGGSSESTNVHSIETPGVLTGIDLMNMAISRKISLMHIRMIVISEELAREGVSGYIAPLVRYRETRKTAVVVVSRGNAADFIKENKVDIGGSISKTTELMATQSRNTGYFPFVNFNNFYRTVVTPYGDPIAMYAGINDMTNLEFQHKKQTGNLMVDQKFLPGELPRAGKTRPEFVGTAVFSGDKMVGSLTPTETRYMLMLTGEFGRGSFTISDRQMPESAIALNLRLGRRPKIKGYFVNGVPIIDATLRIEADIGGIQSRINYERLGLIEDLNDQIKKYLEEEIQKTIAKTQTELKADVFEFGKKIVGQFSTIQAWEEYNWLKHYPEAKINVHIDVNVRRTGLMVRSSPIFTPKGKK